jgi:hypothetical protein
MTVDNGETGAAEARALIPVNRDEHQLWSGRPSNNPDQPFDVALGHHRARDDSRRRRCILRDR